MRRNAVLSVIMAFICAGMFSCAADNEGITGIDVPVDSGVVSPDTPYVIKRVDHFSPAYDAGLEAGDEIIQINQTEIKNGMVFRDIHKSLLKGKPGTGMTVYVKRNGRILVCDFIMAGKKK